MLFDSLHRLPGRADFVDQFVHLVTRGDGRGRRRRLGAVGARAPGPGGVLGAEAAYHLPDVTGVGDVLEADFGAGAPRRADVDTPEVELFPPEGLAVLGVLNLVEADTLDVRAHDALLDVQRLVGDDVVGVLDR